MPANSMAVFNYPRAAAATVSAAVVAGAAFGEQSPKP